MRATLIAVGFLFACGSPADGNATDGSGGAGGSGGASDSAATCGGSPEPAPDDGAGRPKRLRQVRARDSRALEPNTLTLAVAPEPQTLWLPSAKDNDGAIVVVKDATGSARGLTVITTERDVFMVDDCTEYETLTPWASWTFVAFADGGTGPGWLLLDAVD